MMYDEELWAAYKQECDKIAELEERLDNWCLAAPLEKRSWAFAYKTSSWVALVLEKDGLLFARASGNNLEQCVDLLRIE